MELLLVLVVVRVLVIEKQVNERRFEFFGGRVRLGRTRTPRKNDMLANGLK